jgi:hypothetical protein
VIAVATSPLGQLLAVAEEEAGKCHGKTCGWMGYFAVALMFLVLCGGVWLLLQSSFGPLQAYLVSGAAFWGCWFVLAMIWFTGVPGFPIPDVFGAPDVPPSTPRYYGPQGGLPSWSEGASGIGDRVSWIDSEGTQRPSDVEQIKSAETAATDFIAKHYAEQLKVEPAKITVPQVAQVTKREIARDGGGIKYIRLTTGPAKPGATATAEEQDLIEKVEPATFVLEYDSGTEALPTQVALPLTFGLFAVHMFGLLWYERRYRTVVVTPRERERETAGVA